MKNKTEYWLVENITDHGQNYSNTDSIVKLKADNLDQAIVEATAYVPIMAGNSVFYNTAEILVVQERIDLMPVINKIFLERKKEIEKDKAKITEKEERAELKRLMVKYKVKTK